MLECKVLRVRGKEALLDMEDLMFLKSVKYPGIEYEAGEEIFLSPQEAGTSFYLDVDEELTSNDAAMALIASTLDEVDALLATAKEFLKQTLSSKDARSLWDCRIFHGVPPRRARARYSSGTVPLM